MAKKTVKRITLSGGKAVVEEQAEASTSAPKKSPKVRARSVSPKSLLRPVTGPIAYLKGSWYELRQVRWPSRSSTWGLTVAVIGFTLFFVLVILVLDAAFQFLFKEVLLK